MLNMYGQCVREYMDPLKLIRLCYISYMNLNPPFMLNTVNVSISKIDNWKQKLCESHRDHNGDFSCSHHVFFTVFTWE